MKEIQLAEGKVALVDDEDFEYLNQWRWSVCKRPNTCYAFRYITVNKKIARIWMHRLILGLIDSKILGDHIDHNGLNNQRSNIRESTHSENSMNRMSYKGSTSKYLGVYLHTCKQRGRVYKKWRAEIGANKKKIFIGNYKTEEDAARAYNEAAKKYHGEFANLNIV